MKICLSIAEEKHIPAIIGLLDEAAEWLHEVKRSDQWPRPHPAPHKRQARLAQGIRAQRTWIGWADNTPIATITAEETGDPALWTEEELAEPATYIHRLVVSRSYARKALGTELLTWAGMRAAQQYRARWIRLDAWTTNTALHTYYMRQGFELVRYSSAPANPSGTLFQKPIDETAAPSEQIFTCETTKRPD
jgi:GNAT superfamily N-acetyltransferase